MLVFLGAVHCLLLLRYLCRLPGKWIFFILIGAWNATALDGKRCATKSACFLFPSPSAPVILRATLSGIFSGVDNDYFVTILVERVTCLLECYDQCLVPRKHACLKLRDDPVISGPATAHSAKTLTAQIEGRTMHLQLFILLIGVLVESNH